MLMLGGCSNNAEAPHLSIAGAQVEQRGDTPWLVADCRWQPSEAMIEALEHGIALTLAVRVEAPRTGWFATAPSSEQHVELRYFPLTRTYQWRHREDGSVRSYAVRSSALSALERLELPLGHDFAAARDRGALRIAFDTAALPGALQLPRLLQRAWRQPAAHYAWHGANPP